MQPTGPTATPQQADLLSTMQPQPQTIFIPSSGSNNATGNIRPSQQTNTIYRGTSTSTAARGGTRHVSMQPMFQQPIHQSVVMPSYQTFAPRQPAYQSPQYPYSQTIQQFYPYSFYSPMQQPPAHQRGPVGVNPTVSVNVGSALSVQQSLNGPPGTSQTQMALTPGAVLSVPPCSNAVLGVGVSSTGPGQQQVGVGISSLLGVGVPVSGTVTSQVTSQRKIRRKHALDIIHPDTKRNIFEDIESVQSAPEAENQEKITTIPVISPDIQMVSAHPHQLEVVVGSNNTRSALQADNRSIIYNMDMHQITQQRDLTCSQTPVVSAMSDAPSVEIRPVTQKTRMKKVIPISSPKDEIKTSSLAKSYEINIQQQDNHEPQRQQNKYQEQQQNQKKQQQQFFQELHKEQLQWQRQQIQTASENSVKLPNIQEELLKVSQLTKERPLRETNTDSMIHISTQELITTITDTAKALINDTEIEMSPKNLSEKPAGSDILTLNASISPDSHTFETVDELKNDYNSNRYDKAISSKTTDMSSTISTIEPIASTILTCEVVNENEKSLKGMKFNDKENATIITNQTTTATVKKTANLINNDTVATFNGFIESCKNNATKINACVEESINNNLTDTTEEASNIITKIEKYKCEEFEKITMETIQSLPTTIDKIEKIACKNNDGSKVSPAAKMRIKPASNKHIQQFNELSTTKTFENPATVDAIHVSTLIDYEEGQWSPLNPTGKKQYNRHQLLLLREAQASRIQPTVKNPSILPQPNLMPSFARVNNSTKRVQSMIGPVGNRVLSGDSRNLNKQSSMSGVNSQNSGMYHINLSLNQDVKLNETDNAWRPRALISGNENENDPDSQAEREKEELIRSVRGILNKLTPEKFDALVEEIIKLKIDTPDKMEDVIVLVFEKAIDEPNFSVSYARLCQRLISEVKARDERMESGTKAILARFRNALLDKTEREFTQNVSRRSAKEAKLQPILDKIKNCTDPAEKIELQAQLEEEERKIRRRSGGTVRFIGELFKISMLTGKIINHCIEVLLEPKTEDMLECLCKLLSTVGAKFEQTIAKDKPTCYSLDQTMNRMQAIASKTDNSKVSSRVRFMLQDVIDLRKNKWQSSRNEAPKTMEQIEKETKTEQMSSQYLNYSGMVPGSNCGTVGVSGNQSKRDDRGSNRYNDSRSGSGYSVNHNQRSDCNNLRRQQGISAMSGSSGSVGGSVSSGNSNFVSLNDDSTWQVQTSKGGRSLAVDTNKLEGLLNQNLDMGSKKMGGVSQFIWSTQRQSAPTTTPSNSFAVLSTLVDSNKSNCDRDRDRVSHRKGSYNKGSIERDRFNNDRGIQSRNGSSQNSRENSTSRGNHGGRGIMNSPTMQKSASHKNYSQAVVPRLSGKSANISITSASANALNPLHRSEQQLQTTQQQTQTEDTIITPSCLLVPPLAIFEELTDEEKKYMSSVLSEVIDVSAKSKTLKNSIVLCLNRIKEKQRCGLLHYILTDYLHLANIGQLHRRYISNFVMYMLEHKFISIEHFSLAYEHFCASASDMIYDIPRLWLYIFEFVAPLIQKQIVNVKDLWIKTLQEDESPNLGQIFIKSLLISCTREIGPDFTRNMWKSSHMKWTDFMSGNEVPYFIKANKFEYIENAEISPELVIKESREKHICKVVDRIELLLMGGSDHNAIIDYIQGNVAEMDKQFIHKITKVLCDFAIVSKDNSYKVDTANFQKVCIPVLLRYIDNNAEYGLECLYAMQLLVHRLEHPRAILSELFGVLYDSDVISMDLFVKWRDLKDQSAGKGVAVKGLGKFFNNILSYETSDENN